MSEKLFINQEKKIRLNCPECSRQWDADGSPYIEIPKEVKLKVRCTCGHAWSAVLEKRRYFRKKFPWPENTFIGFREEPLSRGRCR